VAGFLPGACLDGKMSAQSDRAEGTAEVRSLVLKLRYWKPKQPWALLQTKDFRMRL
jgi:hypothetical protein